MSNRLYYIYLPYCKPCVAQKEILRRLQPDYPQIEFVMIDMFHQEEEAKAVNPELIYPFFRLGDVTCDTFMKKAELIHFIEGNKEEYHNE